LHFAQSYGYNKLIDILLDSGASESIFNCAGRTGWEGVATKFDKMKLESNESP